MINNRTVKVAEIPKIPRIDRFFSLLVSFLSEDTWLIGVKIPIKAMHIQKTIFPLLPTLFFGTPWTIAPIIPSFLLSLINP